MSAPTDDMLREAGELYAARSVVSETRRRGCGLGVAELIGFLVDPGRSLTLEEQKALFASPRLRADYQRLKSDLRAVELPMLAAASDGVVDTRRFEGGTLRVHPSRVAGQYYVLLQFNWPAASPSALLLEGASGEFLKRPLPSADAGGQAVLVLDASRESDAVLLRLLTDPNSTGAFLL